MKRSPLWQSWLISNDQMKKNEITKFEVWKWNSKKNKIQKNPKKNLNVRFWHLKPFRLFLYLEEIYSPESVSDSDTYTLRFFIVSWTDTDTDWLTDQLKYIIPCLGQKVKTHKGKIFQRQRPRSKVWRKLEDSVDPCSNENWP